MCANESAEKLPDVIEAMRLVNAEEQLAGYLPLSAMQRLEQSIANQQGKVTADLKFGADVEGYAYIKGKLNTTVNLICQRCMDTMQAEINQEFLLSPVFSANQVKNLPESYEAVLVDEQGRLSLQKLLEDEIILHLPIVAKHANQDCADLTLTEEPLVEPDQTKPNPFAVLAALKHKEGKQNGSTKK